MENSYEKARKLYEYHYDYITYLGTRSIILDEKHSRIRILDFNLDFKCLKQDATYVSVGNIFLDLEGESITY
jgi:hypothetical protein